MFTIPIAEQCSETLALRISPKTIDLASDSHALNVNTLI